jgi:predicted enzyme related to lactoylglutathione lyase
MTEQPTFSYVTLSSHRAEELVRFYRGLTGSPVAFAAGAYTVIGPDDPGRGARLAFQQIAAGSPVVPAHVDLNVTDLDAAAARVTELGGRVGDRFEEVGSVWRQAFDPDGNVFCLMGRA